MKIAGLDIQWSDQPSPETRGLEQVTDIGVAFQTAQDRITGVEDTSLPSVFRAVQLLTDITAGLHMEQIQGGVATPETPPILANPNPVETYHQTLSKVMASLLFRGNAFLWPRTREQGTGIITSCIVLNPDEVTITPDRQNLYPLYTWRGVPMEADTEIVHIPLNSWPGRFAGVGPITAARLMLEGGKAEQNLSRALMVDDSTPSGALRVPTKITKTEAESILEIWEETHKGTKRPGVLGGGTEWQALSFSPVDAQFIETRQFTVQEIARIFGLHGFFLLVDSGSSLTYSTTESLFRLFLTMTLSPTYLERIEQSFSRMLPTGSTARFNTDEILRADIAARYQAYQIGLQEGFLTIAEVRRMERLPGNPTAVRPVPYVPSPIINVNGSVNAPN